MALLFDAAAHEYWLDGVLVPSNTGVLRDSGLISFDGIPPFVLEAARTRGTAVHQLVHYQNENDLDWASVDDVYRPYLEAWLQFREQTQLVVLLCEYRVASRVRGVGGTLDLLCSIGGDGWLLDYKTGDPEDVAADLQTAGYLDMAQECARWDPRLAEVLARHARWRRASVRLCKDGRPKQREYQDPRDLSDWQALVVAWHIRQARGAIVHADEIAA